MGSAFVESLPHMRDVKVSATLPVFKKRYYSWFDHYLQLFAVRAAKAAAKVIGEFPVPLPKPKGETPVLVWKSIESIGRLGLFAQLFPAARCIHILRHPCGYVASVKRGEAKDKFSERLQSSEDYGVYEHLLETQSSAPAWTDAWRTSKYASNRALGLAVAAVQRVRDGVQPRCG